MAQPLPKTLNLLQPAEKPVSTWDKIYQWVFTVGRYVIIAVELIVLVAFAMRFMLDRRNNDLKDEIDVKVKMLDAQEETEKELRRIQTSLSSLSGMLENQEIVSDRLEVVLNDIPSEVVIDGFAISQENISLNCRAPEYEIAGELEDDLRENPDYADISVTLSKSGPQESEVQFTILINFGQE